MEMLHDHSFDIDGGPCFNDRPGDVAWSEGSSLPNRVCIFTSNFPGLPQHWRCNFGEPSDREPQRSDNWPAEEACQRGPGAKLWGTAFYTRHALMHLYMCCQHSSVLAQKQVSVLVDQSDIHMSSSFPDQEFSSSCSKKLSGQNIRAHGSLLR